MSENASEPTSNAQSRYAAEWGLASLLLAMALITFGIATLALILAYMGTFLSLRPSKNDVQLTATIAMILTVLFLILSVMSLTFGWIGVRAAWTRSQPAGLPVAGTLLSIVAVLVWAAVIVALVGNILHLSRNNFL